VILDSSAIVAIVREEAGWERLYEVMATAESLSMSAASYVEMGSSWTTPTTPAFRADSTTCWSARVSRSPP